MKHSKHTMDINSLHAFARLKPEVLRARIADALALGIARTARELAQMTSADIVSVRARLSDGCNPAAGESALFRKAVQVEEDGGCRRVWAFGLAKIATNPAEVGTAQGAGNGAEYSGANP